MTPDFSISTSLVRILSGMLCIVFGVVHIMMTGAMAKEFKFIITAHRKIFIMTWIVQGLFFLSIGSIVTLLAIVWPLGTVSILVTRVCAAVLFCLVLVIGSTGSQSEKILIRAEPIAAVAAAFALLAACAIQ